MYRLTSKKSWGFTLAELLSALAILGVIATFTIPKVLNATASGQYNSIAKETIGAMSEALTVYRVQNSMDASTEFDDITPFINYIRVDTSSLVDGAQTLTSLDCGAGTHTCLVLANGGILYYGHTISFGGTGALNAIPFHIDPDGTYSGTTTGPYKAVQFWIYFNGRVRTRGSIESSTVYNNPGAIVSNPVTTLGAGWGGGGRGGGGGV